MYLDTMVAILVKDNQYRYGFIGTWDAIVFNSEDLCKHYKKCSVKNYCKQLYKGILKIKDNEVTEDILKKAPANCVTIVDKDGNFSFLKCTPTPGLEDAEKYIQKEMKKL